MKKFTNDPTERKYQNVYKAGGVKPVVKKVVKKKPTMNEIFIVDESNKK